MSSSYVTEGTPAGDFETITVSSTAVPFTASKVTINQAGGQYKRAVKAFITVENNSIRVRMDGTAPTTTVGHLLTAGDGLLVTGDGNVANTKMIAAASDGTVQVTYYYNR
jgi:hypothetical protein